MKFLNINITSEGIQGRIEIIGSISEWNKNNASDFREKCKNLKDSGVTTIHVYLMTVGGDCFQANEIVNILQEFFPQGYSGEGGALVASAGTYIMVNAKKALTSLAKNGQFMIHKPSGGTWGNETDVENYLTLLKNMTVTYYDAYIARLSKNKTEADFKAKWDSGDFWMTAKEAQEWGFVSEVKSPVQIDDSIAEAIKACGSPLDFQIQNKINIQNDMELKVMAMTIGLAADSTEEQVTARLADLNSKATAYDALKADVAAKEKSEKDAKIKAALDKAESDKRIKPEARKDWQQYLEANFETGARMLNAIPVVSKMSTGLSSGSVSSEGTYQGKTWEQLQDESPEMLASLESEKPEVFEALFADYKKRNNIK